MMNSLSKYILEKLVIDKDIKSIKINYDEPVLALVQQNDFCYLQVGNINHHNLSEDNYKYVDFNPRKYEIDHICFDFAKGNDTYLAISTNGKHILFTKEQALELINNCTSDEIYPNYYLNLSEYERKKKFEEVKKLLNNYINERLVVNKNTNSINVFNDFCYDLKDVPNSLSNIFMTYDDNSGSISVLAYKNYGDLMKEYNLEEKNAKMIDDCLNGETVNVNGEIYTRIQ